GCNSGGGIKEGEGRTGEDGKGGGSLSEVMMEVGRSAENAFYAFMGLIADTLGFTAKSITKKSDVGEYFSSLGAKLGEASGELEKVANKATSGVDKSDALKNPIRVAVEAAKGVLDTLKGHLESLKGIGGDDNKIVGWAESDKEGAAANTEELKKAYKALKGIVETATKEGVEELNEGNVQMNAVTVGVSANPEHGAKILATNAAGKPAAGDTGKAALIVSTVSGEEMLASIVKPEEKASKITGQANAQTTPLEFAVGGDGANLAQNSVKPSSLSGGIALRSLVKAGKLAANNNNDEKAAQAAGLTAVNKLLIAVEDIIKKTVKKTLEKAKEKIDDARKPKTAE
ncbi:Variable major outer membrane lipoprotein, partial [Borrelia duttonii CR2A]